MRFKPSSSDIAALCRQAPEFCEMAKSARLGSFECTGDLFSGLVQSVTGQQLCTSAADAIYARVLELFGGDITAEALINADTGQLRACGLSCRKIEYLRGIAEAQLTGGLDFAGLSSQSDAEIISELTQLKGVGEWTAEMLLIFTLGRPDVVSFKDLGIRKGMMLLYGLDELTQTAFDAYRRRYSPYGTIASLLLWRIKDKAAAQRRKKS